MMNFRRFLLSSTAFALIAGSEVAHAQTPPLRAETLDNTSPASPLNSSDAGPLASSPVGTSTSAAPSSQSGAGTTTPNAKAPTGPEFQWNASVNFSESYVTNATGSPGASQPDYVSSPGFVTDLHEHSRRISLDANYNFATYFYAKGTVPTQISNYLQALGNVDVIPEYLDLNLKAFAQPVATSNFGVVSEGGREVPGAYANSYGYFATPDLKFNWGDVATFKTMPSYGQDFFMNPPGSSALNTIPGLSAPDNTTIRSLTEIISSGPDFGRLNWNLIGLFNETDQQQSLLSEKSGIAKGRYAFNYEWSLIVTAGYDAVTDTVHLLHNVSGPVALAGFGLTLGPDFSLQAEAGERYNSPSFDGNLRYNLTPRSVLTASVNDFVQTPEGQLLNSLTSLTALPNGILTSANNVLGNGMASTLTPFSVQSPDNPALTQFVSRNQTATVSFIEEFERTHASLQLFGTHQTFLTPGFTGPPTADSWGAQLLASRNLTPLFVATLGGGYTYNEEFGGHASTINVQGELNYSLGRQTRIFLRSAYADRLSSASLLDLSPLSGGVTGFSVTLGISHAL